MTGRLTNLLQHLSIVLRYRVLAARRDPKAMYEFVNLLTRFHFKHAPSGLPEAGLSDLLPDLTPASGITLLSPSPEFFSIDVDELWTLCMLARSAVPQRIFEFGTFDGFTTLHLAANSAPAGEVFTIDRQAGRYDFSTLRAFPHSIAVGGRFQDHALAQRIRRLTGDTRTFDFTPYAGTCGLVFLDADHSEEGTRIDTGNAMTLLQRGGMLLWHDCFADGVKKFLKGFSKNNEVCRIRSTTLAFHRKP
jgi:predicted O-methyltransferase YrrM